MSTIKRFTLELKQGQVYSIHALTEAVAFKNIIAHSEPNYNPDWGYKVLNVENK
jgi:hypothetical protein